MNIEFTAKHQLGSHKLFMENGLEWSADEPLLQESVFFLCKSPKIHVYALCWLADFNN
jgi:hypothetical protein